MAANIRQRRQSLWQENYFRLRLNRQIQKGPWFLLTKLKKTMYIYLLREKFQYTGEQLET